MKRFGIAMVAALLIVAGAVYLWRPESRQTEKPPKRLEFKQENAMRSPSLQVVLRPMRSSARPKPLSAVRRAPEPRLAATFEEAAERWNKETENPEDTENFLSYLMSVAGLSDGGMDVLGGVECRKTLCRVSLASVNLGVLQRSQGFLATDGYRVLTKAEGTDSGGVRFNIFVEQGDDR